MKENERSAMEKIHFNLCVVDDYPPENCELIACELVNGDVYLVKEIPFYSKEVSFGDTIFTNYIGGERVFSKAKSHCGNSTIRIVFHDEGLSSIDEVLNKLTTTGVTLNKFSERFIALNIPREINILKIFDYLDLLEEKDILGFESGFLAPSFNLQHDALKLSQLKN